MPLFYFLISLQKQRRVMGTNSTLVMNSKQVQQRLNRLAWQVYETCWEEKEIVIAGIASNGFVLANRIAAVLEQIAPLRIRVIELKVDKESPIGKTIDTGMTVAELRDKTVVVVDDVSNSGKTLVYGVKPFLEFPVKSILTLVLVDRDHNRYPVKTNFVGLSLATTLQEHIDVQLGGPDVDAVYLN
jgi:pyrimidine operon attenuation protein/uracil phosphoribosyltransferase